MSTLAVAASIAIVVLSCFRPSHSALMPLCSSFACSPSTSFLRKFLPNSRLKNFALLVKVNSTPGSASITCTLLVNSKPAKRKRENDRMRGIIVALQDAPTQMTKLLNPYRSRLYYVNERQLSNSNPSSSRPA